MDINLFTVIGTRPQFVKASALSRAIDKFNESSNINHKILHTLIHTGQHYDDNMSDIFFKELGLNAPDILFEIKKENISHARMTSQMMNDLEETFTSNKPDMILVYGDTNTTLAASLTAAKLGIKIAHIESGLRSFNKTMPEEINRILTDHISELLFCPTEDSVNNLKNEGIKINSFKTGDVMLDVNNYYIKTALDKFDLSKYNLVNQHYVLATIHRQESVDNKERLSNLLNAFNEISKERSVILPIHPRTKKMIKHYKLDDLLDNLIVIEPVGYIEMLGLIINSSLVMTDSGGLQKEAVYNEKHCVILREETEWNEIVDSNLGIISGYHIEDIVSAYNNLSSKKFENKTNLYGDGDSAEKILAIIVNHINQSLLNQS